MRPPTSPVPDYSWLPPRKDKDYEHANSSFSKTGLRPNEYNIHPDWISEEMKPMTPFGKRRFRPWAFEFQGARHYPYGTVEQKVAEEMAAREVIESDPCPQEPALPTPEERESILPMINLYTSESRPSWGGKTTRDGKPASHPHNNYSHYEEKLAKNGSQSNGPNPQFSRHMYTNEYFPDRAPAEPSGLPANGLGVYDPPMFEAPPQSGSQRAEGILMSRSASYQPGTERPRFDKPYMNSVNAMWMPTGDL